MNLYGLDIKMPPTTRMPAVTYTMWFRSEDERAAFTLRMQPHVIAFRGHGTVLTAQEKTPEEQAADDLVQLSEELGLYDTKNAEG